MAHPPPIPPDQTSDIIHGASSPPARQAEVKRDPAGGDAGVNLRERGASGNTLQNTTNQGTQQDR